MTGGIVSAAAAGRLTTPRKPPRRLVGGFPRREDTELRDRGVDACRRLRLARSAAICSANWSGSQRQTYKVSSKATTAKIARTTKVVTIPSTISWPPPLERVERPHLLLLTETQGRWIFLWLF